MKIAIAIPTRNRSEYLDTALASIMQQASVTDAEVLVVDDGSEDDTQAVARRHGARCLRFERPLGLNAARNAAVRESSGELIALLDDDIVLSEGWLQSLVKAANQRSDYGVFGGPIRPRLEGHTLRFCNEREYPITGLDLGRNDCELDFAWGANFAFRRGAFELVGPFDETIGGCGDEEDWQRRFKSLGGKSLYVAGAAVIHRRDRNDSRLLQLARASYARGRNARRYDVRKGTVPGLSYELRVLAGCLWHAVRRRCAYGFLQTAHSLGRLRGYRDS